MVSSVKNTFNNFLYKHILLRQHFALQMQIRLLLDFMLNQPTITNQAAFLGFNTSLQCTENVYLMHEGMLRNLTET